MPALFDVIIPAAGVGRRMGAAVPKQYLKLGNKTILEHTVDIFSKFTQTGRIIIALSPGDPYFQTLDFEKGSKVQTVRGGAERSDSVLNGMAKVKCSWVMVHDAARPLLPPEDLKKLIDFIKTGDDNGAILCAKVADTIKAINPENGSIGRTVPRAGLYRALTPQVFKTDLLNAALKSAQNLNLPITDDASAMELMGYHPKLIEGSSLNLKITTPSDLIIARAVLSENSADAV